MTTHCQTFPGYRYENDGVVIVAMDTPADVKAVAVVVAIALPNVS